MKISHNTIAAVTSSSMKSSGFCCVPASNRSDRDDTNVFGTHPTNHNKYRHYTNASVVHHLPNHDLHKQKQWRVQWNNFVSDSSF